MKEDFMKAVANIQTITSKSPKNGAEILKYFANPKILDETINKAKESLKSGLGSNPNLAASYIQSLEIVRAACLQDPEAAKYIDKQAASMMEIQATLDFTKSPNNRQNVQGQQRR